MTTNDDGQTPPPVTEGMAADPKFKIGQTVTVAESTWKATIIGYDMILVPNVRYDDGSTDHVLERDLS
jgi:hypothetical protein